MSTALLTPQMQSSSFGASIQEKVEGRIDDLFAALPNPSQLTREERRGIIARYTAVLEGNFIYWMTAALLSVKAEDSKPILLDNLNEEIRDSHPVMLRKFAIAAEAFPTAEDALAVDHDLTQVRLFLGKMSGVRTVLMMAYFEGFIQKFMAYLAGLAQEQGSTEMEYTDVHGVCDIAHSEGLFRAFGIELELDHFSSEAELFEGVDLLNALMHSVIYTQAQSLAA